MKIIKKLVLWLLGLLFGAFVLTFTIYFFNLDMKLTALIEPLLQKHYDRIPRKQTV